VSGDFLCRAIERILPITATAVVKPIEREGNSNILARLWTSSVGPLSTAAAAVDVSGVRSAFSDAERLPLPDT